MDTFYQLYVPMAPLFQKPGEVDLCRRDIELFTICQPVEPQNPVQEAAPTSENIPVDPDAMDVS
tara:strand:- start:5321 stop:5512 length:192 start_codon:yes stop_codon:yes gene_type:complete